VTAFACRPAALEQIERPVETGGKIVDPQHGEASDERVL
jgi:hypothetical protein